MVATSPPSTPQTQYTPRGEWLAGVRDTLPLMLGAAPFGLIFGASAIIGGLSPLATALMSALVFAGSSQFIGARLYTAAAPIPVIILTTFVVNLRHALYSATLGPAYRRLKPAWLAALAFFLTDETFAVVVSYEQRHPSSPYRHLYQMGSSIAMYLNWNLWTWVGIVAGTSLEGIARLGLDFAMVVTFIGIVVPLVVNRPLLASAMAAGVAALLTYSLPHNLYLMIAAFVGIAVGMYVEKQERRNDR
jgi:4-azaleucine resistance transporter AzlC